MNSIIPPGTKPRILVVDDDGATAEMLTTSLVDEGFDASFVTSAESAIERAETQTYDAVITDVRMGKGMSGIELCAQLTAMLPETPILVVTAFGSMETAIAALRAGAFDFVPKPFNVDEMTHRVRRAVESRTLRAEVRKLREARSRPVAFEAIVGQSPVMASLFSIVDRVAQASPAVLITGETGTGKELVARAIHSRSKRSNGPFVAVNCAAMPENLLESELFGHTKGAFTDARTARAGLFVQANGGVLFLDEIGDMPKVLQAKLLRVLQEHVVRPLGSDKEIPFDARVIAATHRDLETDVADGNFREDLYFRLNVLEVKLPPLRSRGADILLLAQDFVHRISERDGRPVRGLDPECARRLMNYSWPGNVRELANVIERAVALARYDVITANELPDRIRQFAPSHVIVAGDAPEDFVKLEEVERRYLLRVLEATNGHRTKTAQILGLDRKTLYNKLRLYGMAEGQSIPPPPPEHK